MIDSTKPTEGPLLPPPAEMAMLELSRNADDMSPYHARKVLDELGLSKEDYTRAFQTHCRKYIAELVDHALDLGEYDEEDEDDIELAIIDMARESDYELEKGELEIIEDMIMEEVPEKGSVAA